VEAKVGILLDALSLILKLARFILPYIEPDEYEYAPLVVTEDNVNNTTIVATAVVACDFRFFILPSGDWYRFISPDSMILSYDIDYFYSTIIQINQQLKE
jgi:hypothetical protein